MDKTLAPRTGCWFNRTYIWEWMIGLRPFATGFSGLRDTRIAERAR